MARVVPDGGLSGWLATAGAVAGWSLAAGQPASSFGTRLVKISPWPVFGVVCSSVHIVGYSMGNMSGHTILNYCI